MCEHQNVDGPKSQNSSFDIHILKMNSYYEDYFIINYFMNVDVESIMGDRDQRRLLCMWLCARLPKPLRCSLFGHVLELHKHLDPISLMPFSLSLGQRVYKMHVYINDTQPYDTGGGIMSNVGVDSTFTLLPYKTESS